jgi:hypothetical protein
MKTILSIWCGEPGDKTSDAMRAYYITMSLLLLSVFIWRASNLDWLRCVGTFLISGRFLRRAITGRY